MVNREGKFSASLFCFRMDSRRGFDPFEETDELKIIINFRVFPCSSVGENYLRLKKFHLSAGVGNGEEVCSETREWCAGKEFFAG